MIGCVLVARHHLDVEDETHIRQHIAVIDVARAARLLRIVAELSSLLVSVERLDRRIGIQPPAWSKTMPPPMRNAPPSGHSDIRTLEPNLAGDKSWLIPPSIAGETPNARTGLRPQTALCARERNIGDRMKGGRPPGVQTVSKAGGRNA